MWFKKIAVKLLKSTHSHKCPPQFPPLPSRRNVDAPFLWNQVFHKFMSANYLCPY